MKGNNLDSDQIIVALVVLALLNITYWLTKGQTR